MGSGNEPLAGYVNLDRRACPGVNVIADVRWLPFPAEVVDGLYASSLLEHFANPYAVLGEMHRVARAEALVTIRVPSPWSFIAIMDPTHVFLADLKLWRQVLAAYFERVSVKPEGVRYRDSKLLAALNDFFVRVLHFYEFAQAWRFECARKKPVAARPYVPWWLEQSGEPVQGKSIPKV